jgi:hypothetical protein
MHIRLDRFRCNNILIHHMLIRQCIRQLHRQYRSLQKMSLQR